MKNKTIKMIFAAAVLAICCVTYAGVKSYTAKQEKEQEKEEENETTNVVSLSLNDVKSVEFVIDKKEVAFDKDNDTWIKQDEKQFPVDQTVLNDAVSGVVSLDSERVLENVKDLSEYGLSEPINTIKVTTEDSDGKEETTVLRIGDKNDSEGKYYVSKNDDRNTVYFVESASIDPFENSLYDYAQKEDFPVISSTDKITRISVTGDEVSSYELNKDCDTDFWYIGSGKEKEKADSATVSSLTTSFSSLAYDDFVDYNCQDKGKYGLEKPYATVSVEYQEEVDKEDDTDTESEMDKNAVTEDSDEDNLKDSESETSTNETQPSDTEDSLNDSQEDDAESKVLVDKSLIITIGDETSDGSRYVMVNDSNQVYTMSSDSLLTFLGKTDLDFWDMTVNYLYIDNLESLDVNYNGKDYRVNVSRETSENEDGEEETTTEYSLDGSQLDKTDFITFYNKLINMAGQKRLTDQFETDENPDMTVIFTSTEEKKTKVDYYSYDTNYYAAVVDKKVYLVNKMNVKEMFSAFEKITGIVNENIN